MIQLPSRIQNLVWAKLSAEIQLSNSFVEHVSQMLVGLGTSWNYSSEGTNIWTKSQHYPCKFNFKDDETSVELTVVKEALLSSDTFLNSGFERVWEVSIWMKSQHHHCKFNIWSKSQHYQHKFPIFGRKANIISVNSLFGRKANIISTNFQYLVKKPTLSVQI